MRWWLRGLRADIERWITDHAIARVRSRGYFVGIVPTGIGVYIRDGAFGERMVKVRLWDVNARTKVGVIISPEQARVWADELNVAADKTGSYLDRRT